MTQLEILNPVATPYIPQAAKLAPRPKSLEGKTLGLVWNGGPNGDIALKRLGELIQIRVKNLKVEFYGGTRPLLKPLFQKAQQECDVIVGLTAD